MTGDLPDTITAAEADERFGNGSVARMVADGTYVYDDGVLHRPEVDTRVSIDAAAEDPPPESAPMLEHALRCAADGERIFPCIPATKVPHIKKYHSDASSDPDQVRRWWSRWPDALIAARIPDDLLVIDVDPKHRGDTTWEALGGNDIASDRRHASGRNDGGRHHWYKRPNGMDKPSTVRLDAWARERRLGHEVGTPEKPKWTAGIDVLTSTHRYSILPPSLHPDAGEPYRWDAEGEPSELPDVLVELLAPPKPKPRPEKAEPTDPFWDRLSASETPADWYSRTKSWCDILEPHDWELVNGDGDEDGSLWKHPTATAASSASVRHGCLFVYSPNTAFEVTAPEDPHGYTRFAAYALLEHEGDESEAASVIRRTMMAASTASNDQQAPANVDPKTGEITSATANLSPEFWQARPVLAQIHQAAQAARVAPTAVLAGVLARIAACTPPTYCVPPFTGGTVPLSTYVALIGGTGEGKTAPDRVAARLLPQQPQMVIGPLPLGSGEGLVEAFLERYQIKEDNRTVTKQRQQYYGAVFSLDEGEALAQIGGRSGSTLITSLRTAWTGGVLGQQNASQDRTRRLDNGQYAVGIVSLWQPTRMADLFADTDGGLPGRFLFLPTTDPDVPETRPDWPDPIDWTPPPWEKIAGISGQHQLEYPSHVAAAVDDERRARLTGHRTPPLDAHRTLARLKYAGLFAMLDGCRTVVDDTDWELAGTLLEVSDATRTMVLDVLAHERNRADQEGNAKAGRREVAKLTAVETRARQAAVRAVGRKAHRNDGPTSRRDLSRAIKGSDRALIDLEDVLGEAERLGYIVTAGDDGWTAGGSRPS